MGLFKCRCWVALAVDLGGRRRVDAPYAHLATRRRLFAIVGVAALLATQIAITYEPVCGSTATAFKLSRLWLLFLDHMFRSILVKALSCAASSRAHCPDASYNRILDRTHLARAARLPCCENIVLRRAIHL